MSQCVSKYCYHSPTRQQLTNSLKNVTFVMVYKTSVLLTQYCAGGKIEKNKMGGACGAYGGGERCAQGFCGEV